MNLPDYLVMSLIVFPIGWFINLACIEAGHAASNKWDRVLWRCGSLFGSFLMGLAFVSLVWHLPH